MPLSHGCLLQQHFCAWYVVPSGWFSEKWAVATADYGIYSQFTAVMGWMQENAMKSRPLCLTVILSVVPVVSPTHNVSVYLNGFSLSAAWQRRVYMITVSEHWSSPAGTESRNTTDCSRLVVCSLQALLPSRGDVWEGSGQLLAAGWSAAATDCRMQVGTMQHLSVPAQQVSFRVESILSS